MREQDEQFKKLQKLLQCKKYEQPPPGYFVTFSDRVLAQLEAEQTYECSSWWNWLLARFDAKPVLVCAYGVAVSSLLLFGFRLSQVFEAEMASTPKVSGAWLAASPASPSLLVQEFNSPVLLEAQQPSFFSSARYAVREESERWLLPSGRAHVQTTAFTFSGQ